jgi:hypothetical protein
MHAPSMDDRMTIHLNLNIRMLYDATLLQYKDKVDKKK